MFNYIFYNADGLIVYKISSSSQEGLDAALAASGYGTSSFIANGFPHVLIRGNVDVIYNYIRPSDITLQTRITLNQFDIVIESLGINPPTVKVTNNTGYSIKCKVNNNIFTLAPNGFQIINSDIIESYNFLEVIDTSFMYRTYKFSVISSTHEYDPYSRTSYEAAPSTSIRATQTGGGGNSSLGNPYSTGEY